MRTARTSTRRGILQRSLYDQQTPAVHRRIGYLATAEASGRPHVVPICSAVAGEVLYTVIDRKPKRAPPEHLRRARNILQNPRAAIVVNTYSEDWSRLGHVMLEGPARILRSGQEHAAALMVLRQKYEQYRAIALEDRPVIAVTITHAKHLGTL